MCIDEVGEIGEYMMMWKCACGLLYLCTCWLLMLKLLNRLNLTTLFTFIWLYFNYEMWTNPLWSFGWRPTYSYRWVDDVHE